MASKLQVHPCCLCYLWWHENMVNGGGKRKLIGVEVMCRCCSLPDNNNCRPKIRQVLQVTTIYRLLFRNDKWNPQRNWPFLLDLVKEMLCSYVNEFLGKLSKTPTIHSLSNFWGHQFRCLRKFAMKIMFIQPYLAENKHFPTCNQNQGLQQHLNTSSNIMKSQKGRGEAPYQNMRFWDFRNNSEIRTNYAKV